MSTDQKNGILEDLRAFVQHQRGIPVHAQAQQLVETGGFIDRFNYFMQYVPESGRRNVLVSGSAVGTELLVARDFGFQYAYGTEVEPELAAISRPRLAGISGCETVLYDGTRVPFGNASFDVVASGHIIEHVDDPAAYLFEHLRVLRPGGILFLEFPDRNHPIELHQNAPGFEWMPEIMRELTYAYLGSACCQVSPERAAAYRLVFSTLNAVGIRDVLDLVRRSPYPARLRHTYKPLPGFVRSVFVREDSAPGDAGFRGESATRRASFYDCSQEFAHGPKTNGHRAQIGLLLDPDCVAEAGDRLTNALVFLLWAVGRFFALGNRVTDGLDQQIDAFFPGFDPAPAVESPAAEDRFIPEMFGRVYQSIPAVHGPYWQAIVVSAFQSPRLRRALARYYSAWINGSGNEFRDAREYMAWPGPHSD